MDLSKGGCQVAGDALESIKVEEKLSECEVSEEDRGEDVEVVLETVLTMGPGGGEPWLVEVKGVKKFQWEIEVKVLIGHSLDLS